MDESSLRHPQCAQLPDTNSQATKPVVKLAAHLCVVHVRGQLPVLERAVEARRAPREESSARALLVLRLHFVVEERHLRVYIERKRRACREIHVVPRLLDEARVPRLFLQAPLNVSHGLSCASVGTEPNSPDPQCTDAASFHRQRRSQPSVSWSFQAPPEKSAVTPHRGSAPLSSPDLEAGGGEGTPGSGRLGSSWKLHNLLR
eukprot:1234143-Rhodomonas_salina.1